VISHRVNNITQSANRTSFDDLNAALGLVVGQVGGRGVRPAPIIIIVMVAFGCDRPGWVMYAVLQVGTYVRAGSSVCADRFDGDGFTKEEATIA
jgi:L-cystine uptake protein TcyP (sodium:dicarboxylate symporter family)